jgi:hypothetical protein
VYEAKLVGAPLLDTTDTTLVFNSDLFNVASGDTNSSSLIGQFTGVNQSSSSHT